MKGVKIKVFYGNRYTDEKHDVEKTNWDYQRIDSAEGAKGFLRDKIQYLNQL